MRLALVLPALTDPPGGVQRFGDAIHDALRELAGVEAFRVHPAPASPRGLRARAAALGRGWSEVRRRHRERPFDAVFTTFHWPWRLLERVPMVGFVHDLRSFGLVGDAAHRARRRSPRTLGLRAIWRSWDRVLVPSAHVAADVRRVDPALRVVVVGEGLDHLDAWRSSTPPGRDLLLVLGGRSPHKRGALAADVASRAAQALGCEAIVLGEAPSPVGAGARVASGYDDRQLRGWLERARVFVAPSRYEGFGLAAGEAMRAGAPVVYAVDCPMEELVGDGGLPAQPDTASMIQVVTAAWADAEAIGARARARAAGLTWRATAERVLRELEELQVNVKAPGAR
jgi:glycosyltransferase involved in cell wall biosynthesis